MNTKLKIIIAAGVLAGLAAAAGGAWYIGTARAPAAGTEAKAEARKPKSDKPLKYVTLDKVIVMLRRGADERGTHYLSTDLVLATTADQEKDTKEHLPLLRSIAVRALSAHTMAEASAMSVEQFAEQLNKTFDANYADQEREKPFSEVMIGKLIIE
jgi:flagellar FliL protein